MATNKNFELRQGRTGNILATITGISDWTDILARMFITKGLNPPSEKLELVGVVDVSANKITFPYTFDNTDALKADTYAYEIILYKADKTYVKTALYGTLKMIKSQTIDPTA